MNSNKVQELVEAPKRIKPIGCKRVYKRKRVVDGNVETFKARLVAKGYSQKPSFDYDETFVLVAMLKSNRILLSIVAHLDYEIWKMDVKTRFLNDNLDESIYMMQPDGFVAKGQEHMVCKFHKSIYGLRQTSLSWNKCFDQAVKTFEFDQNEDKTCVYKKVQGSRVVFMIFYVDDNLLIGNDVGLLSFVKIWLSTQFQMKDLGETQYILRIKVFRDCENRKLALSEATYIDKLLVKYVMQDSKKGLLPFRHIISLSHNQCPKTPKEKECMQSVPYAFLVGSLMYAMQCIRPNICFVVGMVSRYQFNPSPKHRMVVKHILKYLRRMKDYVFVL